MIKFGSAMMICVGFRGSSAIKYILVQVDGEGRKLFPDMARGSI